MENKVNNKGTFRSIKCRLLFAFLCTSLIPIVLITSIGYYLNRSALKRDTLNWLKAIAQSRKAHVLASLDAEIWRTVDFASDGLIKDSLETIGNEETHTHDVVVTLNTHLVQHKLPLDHHIVALAVADMDGRIVSSTSELLIGKDVSEQDIFLQTISKELDGTFIGQPFYVPSLKTNCFPIAAIITSRESFEPIGVIINYHRLTALSDVTDNRAGMGQTGGVYLVNKEGIMLTESRFVQSAPLRQVVDTEPIRKIATEGKEMAGIYPDYRDVSIVGASAYIPEYGWTLLAEIDKAEAFASVRTLGIIALIIGVASVGAVTGVGIIFAISTARPINLLTAATERFSVGDLEHRTEVVRKDEIGLLAYSFNDMAAKLAEYITERKHAEEKLRELNATLEQHVADRTADLSKSNKLLQAEVTKRMEEEEELKNTVAERNENIEDLRHVMEFSTFINEETQEGTLLDYMVATIKDRFNPDVMAVFILDRDKNMLDMPAITPAMTVDELVKEEVIVNPSLCRVIRTGRGFVTTECDRAAPVCQCLKYQNLEGGQFCLPMIAGGNILGTVVLLKKEPDGGMDEKMHKLLSTYLGLTTAALHRIRLMDQARHTAITDPLTGIYNRRFFDEMLSKQIALAERHDSPLSVLIIDLDHFKDFNDTYGHQVGDRVLQGIATIIRNSIRTSDILARYGGEEFGIIMPVVSVKNGAVEKAEIIRQTVESYAIDGIVSGKTLNITISIGIASYPDNGIGPETLIGSADRALYRAKEGGRNRVEVSCKDKKP